ncbi:MAG: endonuclease/exonuclease/phosphatase family protein [Gammaproteobacteria bacterium]
MIHRIEIAARRLRQRLSRSAVLGRLLRLPVSEGAPTRPGLLIIQVDGLSRPQLESALAAGEMPFLDRLRKSEHYRLHSHYSGLPSTTPAVQGELFYGVKCAVPAFAFRRPDPPRVVRMYDPEAAAEVEAMQAAEDGEPLLAGGSAYADTFTGGAAESHFCPSSMGWGSALRAANPLVVAAFLLSNFFSFLRVLVLLVLELGIAVVDVFRGLVGGYDFIKELKFVPTRVGICVLLRELCVIGGKIDLHRGLPIIHINFLGYDEQAHRRGPGSLFAHWTLKGIDKAVARLWSAAHRSPLRRYDVWIHSDHGQSNVERYDEVRGTSLEQAVDEALASVSAGHPRGARQGEQSIQTHRVRFLGGQRVQRLFMRLGMETTAEAPDAGPTVAALGPVGHIYLPDSVSPGQRSDVARELALRHGVPAVLTANESGDITAYLSDGTLELPRQTDDLVGPDHPFGDAIAADLVSLCGHPDAGDLVALGWRAGHRAVTFATENGAHAGVSPEETHGFALLPGDAPLADPAPAYLRPLALRQSALAHLGRGRRPGRRSAVRAPETKPGRLRIMSYNVHSCIGMDGQLDVERIARVIALSSPDVVALQELDVGRARTGGLDQAHLIARLLKMEFHFHPALHIEEERYGDAILTHLPMRLVKAAALPGLVGRPDLEPRGAIWVAVEAYGREIQVLNTHLGLLRSERRVQVEALLGDEWLGHPHCRSPVVLMGDFNALPGSDVCRRVRDRLHDAQAADKGRRAKNTFPGRFPAVRIDHVFVDQAVGVAGVEVPASTLARMASDHLPLVADLQIPVASVQDPG